ncbi:heterocycloanthracin/sonorensin family bacteriocin [bacterium LRH843]|nr:heterocycloanthracin/sonorensin family bacteriocin [bacterium LRH843]
MDHYQNELQGLGMDQFQVGELTPMDPQSQDPRQFHGGRCGGRCGGFHRCGGFNCFGCFGCFGCFFGFWF